VASIGILGLTMKPGSITSVDVVGEALVVLTEARGKVGELGDFFGKGVIGVTGMGFGFISLA